MCGKDIDDNEREDSWGFVDTLGYYSKYDGSKITMDLCPECVDKIIEQCIISPIETFDDEDLD